MKKWMYFCLGCIVLLTIYINKTAIICMGEISYDLRDLEDGFEKKVRILLAKMEKKYTISVRSVYRSNTCQDRIYAISQQVEKVTGMTITTQKGGTSCHNHAIKGVPASLAVDVRPFIFSIQGQVDFYKELEKEANKIGLRTGASFADGKRKNPWRQYGLGWDPGHIDIGKAACVAKLRKMPSSEK